MAKLYAVLLDTETNELIIVPSHLKIALLTEEELYANGPPNRDFLALYLSTAIARGINNDEELAIVSEKLGQKVDEILVPVCSCGEDECEHEETVH